MNLSLSPALPAVTPTPPSACESGAPEGEASGFADCLDQARARPAADPAKARAQKKPKDAPPQDGEPAATPAKPATTDPALDGAAPTAEAAPMASEDSAPIELGNLLPGWTAALPSQSAAPCDAVAAAKQPDAAVALANEAPRSATALRVLAAVAHDTPRRDAARGADATALATAPSAEAAQRPVEPPSPAATPRAATPLPDSVPVGAPATQPASPAPITAPAPAAAPSLQSAAIAPAPQHADFAPALATQVRWWAEAGVQQAQLTLNPAEMGPVTVRIVVNEAREARIDFAADVAATRAAIEGGLPVLAAALDESGLKLTGGGVHDGARERQNAWQHAQSQSGKALHAPHEPRVIERTPPRAAAARGIVDLVA